MVEFGEELIIESFRIPWLIWIQVIVLLLLILLLYSFNLLSSSSPDDLSPVDDPGVYSPSSSSTLHGINHSQKLQQQVGEINVSASGRSSGRSRRLNRVGNHYQEDHSRGVNSGNDNKEVGSSALMKSQSIYNNNHHPCNIVRLAKIAFLKCLGLDSNSTTSIPEHRSSSFKEHTRER